MQRLFHSRAEGQIRRSGGEGFVFSPLMLFISSHVSLAMGLESGGCKMRQRTHIHTHACAQAHTETEKDGKTEIVKLQIGCGQKKKKGEEKWCIQ